MTLMTPPQLHMHFDASVAAGMPMTVCVVEPGAQGAAVTGIQGCGVNTPAAAAVADATCGFARLLHIPNGGMFVKGAIWSIVRTGWFTLLAVPGLAMSVAGAVPKLHWQVVPVVRTFGMAEFRKRSFRMSDYTILRRHLIAGTARWIVDHRDCRGGP